MRLFGVLAVVVLTFGCSANLTGARFACDPENACPSGFTCCADGFCAETCNVQPDAGKPDDTGHTPEDTGSPADSGELDAGTPDEGVNDTGIPADAGAEEEDAAELPDAGIDSGVEPVEDSGVDTGVDAGVDAGVHDAGSDGGCAPQCSGKCGGSDSCGGSCPNNCVAPQTCGGGGTQNVCGCSPKCSGKCGGADSCGGTCPDTCVAPQTCGGGGTQNVCDCVPPNCCGPSPTGKGGDMCDVPASAFMMGCNSAVDTGCSSNEIPYHNVTVPAFKIDKYEVTASEYKACVTASGCTAGNTGNDCNYNKSGKENHPINCVDWTQAKAYCTWAGKRLPTEAEWEKAARGTDGRKYPWGNDALDCNRAVHSASPCYSPGTAVVGSKPTGASPYGAMDMAGNAWEWVEDWYHTTYTGAPTDGSAWLTPTGTTRVGRGGSWTSGSANYLRVSGRGGGPTDWDIGSGFRCAK